MVGNWKRNPENMNNCYRKSFVAILFLCLFGLKSYAQQKNMRYFDETNKEISEEEFREKRKTNVVLDIPGDSLHHRKLTNRLDAGEVSDRAMLVKMLKSSVEDDKGIDWEKPLVIIYYPGQDSCNSSGSSTKKGRKKWYRELEKKVREIAQTKPIYIYKESTGLEKYEGILKWYKDPDGIIEKLFFKHHYPCGSFAIINEKGQYACYFGEYGKDHVWDILKALSE